MKKGFTLLELMVTVSIMVIILSIMVFNFSKTDNKTVLAQIAYGVALNIRQAQVNSISVKSVGGVFENGYGVHFAVGDKYVNFYVDKNGTIKETGLDNGSSIEEIKIPNGYQISDICDGESCSISSADVTFWRPDPSARLTSPDGNTLYGGPLKIELSSDNGSISKHVKIYRSGQISISQD